MTMITSALLDRELLEQLVMASKHPDTARKMHTFAFVPLACDLLARGNPLEAFETECSEVSKDEQLVDLGE